MHVACHAVFVRIRKLLVTHSAPVSKTKLKTHWILSPREDVYMMEMNHCRGDLTDTSAETKPLDNQCAVRLAMKSPLPTEHTVQHVL